jgi:hypothetical protein
MIYMLQLERERGGVLNKIRVHVNTDWDITSYLVNTVLNKGV